MKEKLKLFVSNLINIVFVFVFMLFLYFLYRFFYMQVYGDILNRLFYLLGIEISAVILLIWVLSCLVFMIMNIKINFSVFPYKYEKICGSLLIVVSTIICSFSLVSIMTEKEALKSKDYHLAYDLSELSFTDEAIDYIDQKINKLTRDKTVYIRQGDFRCRRNNEVESFDLSVYFNQGENSYIYDFSYSQEDLHVQFYAQEYGKIADDYPLWDEFKEMIMTISVPQDNYVVSLSSDTQQTIRSGYELSHQYSINVKTIKQEGESISSSYQDNNDYQSSSNIIGQEAGDGLIEGEVFIDENKGYRLRSTDAALGSYFYSLDKTTDGGKHWLLWNKDPFQQELGTAPEIGFIDEYIGFIKMSRGQGDYSHLYRTDDGGKTFSQVILNGNDDYDYLKIPYIQEDKLYLKVYKHMYAVENQYINYISYDKGKTWEKE